MVARLLAEVGKFYILNRARHYKDGFDSEPALWEVVDKWHAPFGAAILKKWDVSDEIREAVSNFANLERPHSGQADLTDVITAADFLDAHFIAKSISALDWESLPPALQHLQLDLEKSEILMNDTREELGQILQAIAQRETNGGDPYWCLRQEVRRAHPQHDHRN